MPQAVPKQELFTKPKTRVSRTSRPGANRVAGYTQFGARPNFNQ